jgi:tRNA (guanine-N7-)-methyltransferase
MAVPRSDLEIEIGSSHGDFLHQIATQFPEKRFVGLELVADKCNDAIRAIKARGLKNVEIVHAEAHAYIRNHVVTSSVSAIHIYFPTPNPNSLNTIDGIAKPVHGRLINPSFVRECHRILKSDGVLRIATDHVGYFNHAVDLFSSPLFALVPFHSPIDSNAPNLVLGTGCERKYKRVNAGTNYAQFVKLFVSGISPQRY